MQAAPNISVPRLDAHYIKGLVRTSPLPLGPTEGSKIYGGNIYLHASECIERCSFCVIAKLTSDFEGHVSVRSCLMEDL